MTVATLGPLVRAVVDRSASVRATDAGCGVRPRMSDRILIIDDDPAVHEVSGACLERDGYIVSSATEGETGLAA